MGAGIASQVNQHGFDFARGEAGNGRFILQNLYTTQQ
jgi:hypothetical protein